MATPSARNSQQSVGQYAPGSIAARPATFAGGVRKRDESPDAFRGRMDAGYAQSAANGAAPMAAGPQPTRRDNIVAARADGSFDQKRDTFNQAGAATGHSMDEAGNITAAPPAAKAGGSLVPGSSPGSSVWKPNTPASDPNAVKATLSAPATAPAGNPSQPMSSAPLPQNLRRPREPGFINGKPAPQAIAEVKAGQAQIPRSSAQNPQTPGFATPTVASAMRPPVTSASPVTSPVTPQSVTASSPMASPPGGMMGAAATAAKGIQTAMTTTAPQAVMPRAQAVLSTLKSRAAAPPARAPLQLWPPHIASKAVAQNKLDPQRQPFSRAGLGLPRTPSSPPRPMASMPNLVSIR